MEELQVIMTAVSGLGEGAMWVALLWVGAQYLEIIGVTVGWCWFVTAAYKLIVKIE